MSRPAANSRHRVDGAITGVPSRGLAWRARPIDRRRVHSPVLGHRARAPGRGMLAPSSRSPRPELPPPIRGRARRCLRSLARRPTRVQPGRWCVARAPGSLERAPNDVRVIDCSGAGGSAPRGQSLLRSQARCALLPAPSPPMMGLFGRCNVSERSNVAGVTAEVRGRVMARSSTYPGGRGGKERAASLRAEQRLAPGGGAPCPGAVNYTNVVKPDVSVPPVPSSSVPARRERAACTSSGNEDARSRRFRLSTCTWPLVPCRGMPRKPSSFGLVQPLVTDRQAVLERGEHRRKREGQHGCRRVPIEGESRHARCCCRRRVGPAVAFRTAGGNGDRNDSGESVARAVTG